MSEFDGIFDAVEERLEKSVATVAADKILEIDVHADARIKEIDELLGAGAKLTVNTDGKEHTLEGLKHKQLQPLIKLVGQRLPALVVGMAGTGKTHAAEQAATALGLEFFAMSVGAQTSKSDIIGYMNANGGYVPTLFRKAYEEGGVFLMDEIDAGNANVLIQVNSALANNYCAFPDGMIKRHENFAFIATANTYGNGANRMYVGRNQLDAATLDRFTILNWMVDETLEAAIVKPYEYGERWHKCVLTVREYVDKQALRALITPRATVRGTVLLDIGYSFDDAIDAALVNGLPADKQQVIRDLIKKTWGKNYPKGWTNKAGRTKELAAAIDPKLEMIQVGEAIEGEVSDEEVEKFVEELPF